MLAEVPSRGMPLNGSSATRNPALSGAGCIRPRPQSVKKLRASIQRPLGGKAAVDMLKTKIPCYGKITTLLAKNVSLFFTLGNWTRNPCSAAFLGKCRVSNLQICRFPCKIPCLQGIFLETGAVSTASPARQSLNRRGWRHTRRISI